jgi:hypothetical protein
MDLRECLLLFVACLLLVVFLSLPFYFGDKNAMAFSVRYPCHFDDGDCLGSHTPRKRFFFSET